MKLNLDQLSYEVIDQLLVNAMGYPIFEAESKLGFPKNLLEGLFTKIRAVVDSGSPGEFTKEEIIHMLRAMSLVFIETGPGVDLETVTGHTEVETIKTYNALDGELKKYK